MIRIAHARVFVEFAEQPLHKVVTLHNLKMEGTWNWKLRVNGCHPEWIQATWKTVDQMRN